jgi:hypothetical protein
LKRRKEKETIDLAVTQEMIGSPEETLAHPAYLLSAQPNHIDHHPVNPLYLPRAAQTIFTYGLHLHLLSQTGQVQDYPITSLWGIALSNPFSLGA